MTKVQREKFVEETFSGTSVGALIENLTSQVKLVAEQHSDLSKDIKSIKSELGDFKNEMIDFRDEMHDFRDETRDNFKLVMGYLSRIEDDFLDLKKKIKKMDKDKVSAKDFNWLKDKVLDIENRLDNYKKQQTTLAAK